MMIGIEAALVIDDGIDIATPADRELATSPASYPVPYAEYFPGKKFCAVRRITASVKTT
jgi:hypothetical protein